jgi:hypothetical protein
MSNRILDVSAWPLRLTPTEAELIVNVAIDAPTEAVEVHGRIMGPQCLYSTTVEVAYPLRRLPPEPGKLARRARVMIPEPSWWDPVSPLLYRGPVELWEGSDRRDQTTFQYGLRHVRLGDRGLSWNGRPLPLTGRTSGPLAEVGLRRLRDAGVNLLIVPIEEMTEDYWDAADRVGLLVLARVRKGVPLTGHVIANHPSCLGWLVVQEEGGDGLWDQAMVDFFGLTSRLHQQLIGVELVSSSDAPLPGKIQFVVGTQDLIARRPDLPVPGMVLGDDGSVGGI